MMRFQSFQLVVLLSVVAFAPGVALAQDPTRDTGSGPSRQFGDPGQVAISSDASLVIQHSSTKTTTIQLAPAADFFVIRELSIGGFIGFDYSKTGSSDASRFSIGPRVGYNIPLSDMVSLWPKIGFSYSHTSVSTDVTITRGTTLVAATTGDAFALNLFVPIMLHPAKHFFAGFGPFLDTDLSGDNKVTVYGGKLTIGGWLDT
jgi:hypothetical protein